MQYFIAMLLKACLSLLLILLSIIIIISIFKTIIIIITIISAWTYQQPHDASPTYMYTCQGTVYITLHYTNINGSPTKHKNHW